MHNTTFGHGGVPNEEDILGRERKRAEERMTLSHRQNKWPKGMKDSGRTMWDEEAENGVVEIVKRLEELRIRLLQRQFLGNTGSSRVVGTRKMICLTASKVALTCSGSVLEYKRYNTWYK